MTPVMKVEQVLEAMQQIKSRATAFCTNFFPAQPKLQSWIDHRNLASKTAGGAAFFLRRDRDFQHLYFCAADPATLERELNALPEIKNGRLAADLIGPESAISPLIQLLQKIGFNPHARLLRLACAPPRMEENSPGVGSTFGSSPAVEGGAGVILAAKDDAFDILKLIESAFDPYADQLPALYEIEAAIANRQIAVVKHEGKVAAALFFETQGFTSVVRYWVVAEPFRSHRFGSLLIRHYFKNHETVRRFILWVTATNQDALSKYEHYGYKPDGLLDQVMVNHLISS
jgi:GNAT superfamily N-acetyltransferase